MPRLAHRRVILFFWPTRASSANQTSIASGATPFSRAISSRRSGRLFKILNRAGSLRVMPRTSRKLAITHGAQFPAQGLPGDDDAEFLEDPLAEIDDPPPHEPMNSRDWAALDDRGKGGSVRVVETRRLSRSLPVDQTRRTIGVT